MLRRNSDEYFEAKKDDEVYVFFRVFSPGRFKGHVWVEWYKETTKGWAKSDRIRLDIVGGRQEGYRGYTKKKNYTEGEWKVVIKSSDDLVLGEIDFEVVHSKSEEELQFQKVIDKS